jgi:glutamate racemase
VYDSGLGGLSVMDSLRQMMPRAAFAYVADTAGFPYGEKSLPELKARADTVIHAAMRAHNILMGVIACNTLSTLCLQYLRESYAIPFVGTVPAIKTAAAQSRTRRFSLLATPRAAASDYSSSLIAEHAAGCIVDRIGAPELAKLCEAALLGQTITDNALRTQIAPAFLDDEKGKTDSIVLGCTHYPLLLERLKALAPWDVRFIDPAPAIALQASRLWKEIQAGEKIAYVTDGFSVALYAPVFARFGFDKTAIL